MNGPNKLYPWQAQACKFLEELGPRTKTAVLSPNGAGKSSVVLPIAALFVPFVHPRGKVRITTADSKQLDDQVIPGIEKHLSKFGGWERKYSPYYQIRTPSGGSIVAFTTDDAGRVEGSHEELPNGPLLCIIDEAKSVNDEIFEGTDRCSYTWLLNTSTPGLLGVGRFWKNCTQHRGNGRDGTFKVIQVGLKDCPHKKKEVIDDIIRTYGENHPFTRSSVFGEFMEQDESTKYIITVSQLERCLQNPPPHRSGRKVAFCDFAAGGDENVIAVREGNRISLEAHWREKDKLAAVGRFIQHFIKLELKKDQIFGDAAARDMLDLLSEAGWDLHRQNFGAPAKGEQYVSWGAYAWLAFGQAVEKAEVILPADDTLKAQLTSRQKLITRTGKLGVMDKYRMRKEFNLPSPDRGDAVCGAWAAYELGAVGGLDMKSSLSIPAGYITTGAYEDDMPGGSVDVFDGIGANAGSL